MVILSGLNNEAKRPYVGKRGRAEKSAEALIAVSLKLSLIAALGFFPIIYHVTQPLEEPRHLLLILGCVFFPVKYLSKTIRAKSSFLRRSYSKGRNIRLVSEFSRLVYDGPVPSTTAKAVQTHLAD
jgi:hypothetical protein